MSQTRSVAGLAALVLVGGVTPLRPEPALFEAMLEGWGRQQRSRRLSVPLVEGRERLVRVLADTLNLSPGTAVRWMQQAGADWNRYAADIARTHDHQP